MIYAVICNLLRNIWFWRENLLLFGLLPELNEVSLHKINYYLAPIINELQSFWNKINLYTNKCLNGKRVRAVLILVSCDIPATRKICGHISALVSCHRCEKRQIMRKGSTILPAWIIWMNSLLLRIQTNIIKMQLDDDIVIWKFQENNL